MHVVLERENHTDGLVREDHHGETHGKIFGVTEERERWHVLKVAPAILEDGDKPEQTQKVGKKRDISQPFQTAYEGEENRRNGEQKNHDSSVSFIEAGYLHDSRRPQYQINGTEAHLSYDEKNVDNSSSSICSFSQYWFSALECHVSVG